jgi:hypothetical protein
MVELFDAMNVSLGVTTLTLDPVLTFAEGQFNYSGPGVKRAIVRFAAPDTRFALDNLVFQLPEPSPLTFLCFAGLYLFASPRRAFATAPAGMVRKLPRSSWPAD